MLLSESEELLDELGDELLESLTVVLILVESLVCMYRYVFLTGTKTLRPGKAGKTRGTAAVEVVAASEVLKVSEGGEADQSEDCAAGSSDFSGICRFGKLVLE